MSANTCNAWTYNSGYAYYGRGGFKTGDYANWIDQSNYACQFSYSILCLCYN